MYSRKDEEEVWKNLQKLHVNFAILEESWCVRRAKYVAIKYLCLLSSLLKNTSYLGQFLRMLELIALFQSINENLYNALQDPNSEVLPTQAKQYILQYSSAYL